MFSKHYKVTDPYARLVSTFEQFGDQLDDIPIVGAYNHGLFMVVDKKLSSAIVKSWSWLLRNKCAALIVTGFGDVFFSDSNGVSFLETERGGIEPVDSEISRFLQDFLCIPRVVDNVLRKKRFDQLVATKGPLKYGQVFILNPWPSLGGVDKIKNYSVGDCDVYLDLVSQSLHE
jgi:hypothetical protein